MLTTTISLLVVAFAVFLLRIHIKSARTRELALKIPGYKPVPILGNLLHTFKVLRIDLFTLLNNFCDEFGPRYRVLLFSHMTVILSDPADAEVVFSNQQFNEKSREYDFLHPWLGTGLLTSTGEKWRSHRKAITPAFHFKILENFTSIFGSRADIFIDKLKAYQDTNSHFNVFPLNALFALDVMCETAMGVTANVQKNSDSPYIRAVNELSNLVQGIFKDPFKRYDFFYKLSNDYKRQKKTLAIIHNTTNLVIKDRRKLLEKNQETFSTYIEESLGVKKKMAFLDLLLLSTIDGKPLNNEEISEEVNTFLFEGYDTTTSAISFCMFLLGENPECQKKAFEEQYALFGDDQTRPATYNELQSMKYLEMVIKETLRLYPSVPLIARKINHETFINDMEIPAGSTIAINVFHMHRNPELFPEPDKFNPERYHPEVTSKRNPFAYVSFSAGSRNCIGQKFVMLEIKSLMSKMLRNFEIKSANIGVELTSALILRAVNGVNIKLASRNYQSIQLL